MFSFFSLSYLLPSVSLIRVFENFKMLQNENLSLCILLVCLSLWASMRCETGFIATVKTLQNVLKHFFLFILYLRETCIDLSNRIFEHTSSYCFAGKRGYKSYSLIVYKWWRSTHCVILKWPLACSHTHMDSQAKAWAIHLQIDCFFSHCIIYVIVLNGSAWHTKWQHFATDLL